MEFGVADIFTEAQPRFTPLPSLCIRSRFRSRGARIGFHAVTTGRCDKLSISEGAFHCLRDFTALYQCTSSTMGPQATATTMTATTLAREGGAHTLNYRRLA